MSHGTHVVLDGAGHASSKFFEGVRYVRTHLRSVENLAPGGSWRNLEALDMATRRSCCRSCRSA
eukprot:1065427-Heterocapsa_arctica.AAC.1